MERKKEIESFEKKNKFKNVKSLYDNGNITKPLHKLYISKDDVNSIQKSAEKESVIKVNNKKQKNNLKIVELKKNKYDSDSEIDNKSNNDSSSESEFDSDSDSSYISNYSYIHSSDIENKH
jgi:hypothetical protein